MRQLNKPNRGTARRAKNKSLINRPKPRISYGRMQRIVAREMTAFGNKPECIGNKYWKFDFFNNFWQYLPGNNLRKSDFGLDQSLPHVKTRKTKRQFVAEIDSIIKKLGLNPHKLAELQTQRIAERMNIKNPFDMTPKQKKFMNDAVLKLCELALPIYIELRRRGYSHRTLAA